MHNISTNYLLATAFQHELTNQLDLAIARLCRDQITDPAVAQHLAELHSIQAYLTRRIQELLPK